MTKIINFFGKTDDGSIVMGIELHPKRCGDGFVPFELSKYNKTKEFVDTKYPNVSFGERINMIDELLFKDND